MCLKEADREEGNGFRRSDGGRVYAQRLRILAIKGIPGVLKAEKIQRTGDKTGRVQGKQPFKTSRAGRK
jgi:hypothetical protein